MSKPDYKAGVTRTGMAPTRAPATTGYAVHNPDFDDTLERWPTATAMLELWAMPWSPRALKFAAWALKRAMRHGCYVLD
jgi:hypothetical protein